MWIALLISGSYLLLRYSKKQLQKAVNKLIAHVQTFSKKKEHPSFQSPLKELNDLANAIHTLLESLNKKIKKIEHQAHEKDAILFNMVEGVITINAQGTITTMNHAAKRYLLPKAKKIKGMQINESIRQPQIIKIATEALKKNELVETDLTLPHPRKLHLHVHGIGLKNSKKECVGALIVLHDVTHIKKLENMRKNFVANVSHELKTPITLIKGFLETLFNGALDNRKECIEFLTIMNNHAERLDTIIEDLLSLSKIEQIHDEELIETKIESMNRVIEKAIVSCQEKAAKKEIAIQFNARENIKARINVSLLEQAVINLIDNAIKYSPSESIIEVSLTQSSQENLVSVSDKGCGIPKKHIPHLFERFYRVDKARSRKLGGTGLGLAIVKHIAQAHKGRVSVESHLNKGSEFLIHIPHIN